MRPYYLYDWNSFTVKTISLCWGGSLRHSAVSSNSLMSSRRYIHIGPMSCAVVVSARWPRRSYLDVILAEISELAACHKGPDVIGHVTEPPDDEQLDPWREGTPVDDKRPVRVGAVEVTAAVRVVEKLTLFTVTRLLAVATETGSIAYTLSHLIQHFRSMQFSRSYSWSHHVADVVHNFLLLKINAHSTSVSKTNE